MSIIAYLSFAIISFISACLAQNGIDEITNGAVGFFAPALTGAIATVQSEFEPSVATSPNVEATASTPQISATTSIAPLASTTSSSTSSHSTSASTSSTVSTSSSAASSSSTTSAAKSSASSTTIAKASSTAAPQGHHPSAKVGVGVGVSLGIIFLALVGFLLLRHQRHKQVSRLRHHGIIAAAGLYPVIDEADDRAREADQRNVTDLENRSESLGHEKDDVHEIQGTEIPPYSRELIGSPGVPRQELAMRRGSV